MTDIDHYEDVQATCDHQPGPGGAEHILHVHGTAVFTTGGWSVEVEQTHGNTGPRGDLLGLDLIARHSGDADTKMLTPVSFDWSDEVGVEYTEVQFFNLRGAEGQPPPVVKVQHLEA